jgi:hypothetical protein
MRYWSSAAVLLFVLGCGSRSVGYLNEGGSNSQPTGGGGQGGSAGHGGGGAPTAFGSVSLSHLSDDGPYGQESLSLTGAFYGQDYDPEEQQWGYVDTVQTPDGVSCDIYYSSGMGGGDGPPEPPAQVNGGPLTAGATAGPDDLLAIAFSGDQYGVDWRTPTSPDHPWPSWVSAGPVAVTFRGTGSAAVGAFSEQAVLPGMPAILAPPAAQQPAAPGPDGNYLIRWQTSNPEQTWVTFHFNLDWDDSAFRCAPPLGVNELLLPVSWIGEWTWGSGEMLVIARNEVTRMAGSAEVILRTQRIAQRNVYFEMDWD